MLTAYVLLDGYDLGVGAIAPFVARDRPRARGRDAQHRTVLERQRGLADRRRRRALRALSAGVYASSFSGFYLPFIVVLWLLMFRGIAMELRDHFDRELWHQFWDAAFCAVERAARSLLFGVALGNLLRGVPLDAHGYFHGHVRVSAQSVCAAGRRLCAVARSAQHGAAFVAMRIDGRLRRERSLRLLRRVWWVVLALYLAVSAATYLPCAALPPARLALRRSRWSRSAALIACSRCVERAAQRRRRSRRRRLFVATLAGRGGRIALSVSDSRVSARAAAGCRSSKPRLRRSALAVALDRDDRRKRSPCCSTAPSFGARMAGKVRVE